MLQSCDVSFSLWRRKHFAWLNSCRGSVPKETCLNIEFKELARHRALKTSPGAHLKIWFVVVKETLFSS